MSLARNCVVSVAGLPLNCKDVEARAVLERHAAVKIVGLKVREDESDVEFQNTEDADWFRRRLPMSLVVGLHNVILRLRQGTSESEDFDAPTEQPERRAHSFCLEINAVNTWYSLKKVPEGGRKGILVQGLADDTSFADLIHYFESGEDIGVDGIAHIFTMADGVFVHFYDEEVASKILLKRPHIINDSEVTILPKIVPEIVQDCLFLRSVRDMKVKYVKLDLDAAEIRWKRVEEIAERWFMITFHKPLAKSDDQLIQDALNVYYKQGIYQVSQVLETDCLRVKVEPSLQPEMLENLLDLLTEEGSYTKTYHVAKDSALVYFSNFEDIGKICKKIETESPRVEGRKAQITRYFPVNHESHLESVKNSGMTRLCKLWGDEREKLIECQEERPPMVPLNQQDQFQTASGDGKTVGIVCPNSHLSPVKLKIFLERACSFPIQSLKCTESNVKVVLGTAEDAATFKEKVSKGIVWKFGDKKNKIELCPSLSDNDDDGELPSDGDDDILPPASPTEASFNFDTVHTWFSRLPDIGQPGTRGIIIPDMPLEISPQEIHDYFHKKTIYPMLEMVPMVDGIFITFQDQQVIDDILKCRTHEIKGKRFHILPKVIPDYFTDMLLMKKTPKMEENLLKLSLSNCSPDSTRPVSIKTSTTKSSLIKYGQNMGLHDLKEIIKRANEDPEHYKLQILLLPKTDCLRVKTPEEGNVMLSAKPVFESLTKTTGSDGKITKVDQTSDVTALVYFSNYKDVEAILQQHEDNMVNHEGHTFEVKPYYHCFSHDHNRLLNVNQIDDYYKKWSDEKKFEDIQYPVNPEVHKLLRLKKNLEQELQQTVHELATVRIHTDEPCLILSPLLVSNGDHSGFDQSSFKKSYFEIVKKFLSGLTSCERELDKKNLEIVRDMNVDPKLAVDYNGSDLKDIYVEWRGRHNEKIFAVGVKRKVDEFIEHIVNLTDIENKSMKINAVKYKWLHDCGVLEEITSILNSVQVNGNDENSELSLTGKNEAILTFRLDLASQLERVHQKKLKFPDILKDFLTTQPDVAHKVLKIFQDNQLKAIFTTECGIPYICATGDNISKAAEVLKAHLCVDSSIELKSNAHYDVMKLDNWEKLVSAKTLSGRLIVKEEKLAVMIAGFGDSVADASEELQQFVHNNLCSSDVFKTDYIKACHIMQFKPNIFEAIGQNYIKWYLNYDGRGISLVGKTDPVKKGKALLVEVARKIEVKSHCIEEHAIVEYFQKNQGEILRSASSRHKCTILVGRGEWTSQDEEQNSIADGSLQNTFGFGFLTVSVVQSNIVWDESDAVICVHHLKASQNQFGIEVNNSEVGQRTGIDRRISVESVANLPNKNFIHISIPENAECSEDLLVNALVQATNLKCDTVTIPAESIGPLEHASQIVGRSLRLFVDEMQDLEQREMKIRILVKNRFKDFVSAISQGDFLQRQRTRKPRLHHPTHAVSSISNSSSSDESSEERANEDSPNFFRNLFRSAVRRPLPSASSDSNTFGSLKVSVQQGDITDANDMIVNSIGSKFELASGGAVSKIILKKGGSAIQKEISSMSGSEIRVTSGGQLPCQKILHVSTPGDVNKLGKCVEDILKEADKQQCSSLSIPAIGTGGLGIPSNVAAREMFTALKNFSQKHQPQHLKMVYIVIFEKPMVQTYESQLSLKQPGSPSLSMETHTRPHQSGGNTFGSLKVDVREGSITNETNDAIVNSLGNDFKLAAAGAVSKVILQDGGQKIQSDLAQATGSEIRVTSGGNLKCKKIFHVATPRDPNKLKAFMINILKEADKEKCLSISIPAIGTGGLGISSVAAAKEIFDALREYSSYNQPQYLKVVDIVVFQKQMIQDFKSQLSNQAPTAASAPQTSTSAFRQRLRRSPPLIRTSALRSGKSAFGSLKVSVRKGDITAETNEIIVNSVGNAFALDNAGAVSKVILQNGGQSIQSELTKATGSEIRVTSGGNLKCTKIFHVATPGDPTKLKDVVVNILKEAENQKCSSISIPAIGTGALGIPDSRAADEIITAFTEYSSNNQPQHLKVVDIVIFQQQMLQSFEARLSAVLANPAPPTRLVPQQQKSTTRQNNIGNIEVSVRQGDITKETSDMIVNSVGSDFSLKDGGATSKIILQNGGESIQSELASKTASDIRVTSGGNLKCKKILHVATPRNHTKLKGCLSGLLKAAEKEKCSTISIPAIGTGGLGFSSDLVAKILFKAIAKFTIAHRPINLRKVNIVVYEQSKVPAFEAGLHAAVSGRIKSSPRSPWTLLKKNKSQKMKGCTLTFSSLTLAIRRGQIFDEESDAIVNNIAADFDIAKGSIPQKRFTESKQQLQADISASSAKDLRITSGGGLRCKKIVHAVFPDDPVVMKSVISKVLHEVEKLNFESLTFPALLGGKGVSIKKITSAILDAVGEFIQNPAENRHLKRIFIVTRDKDTIKKMTEFVSSNNIPGATLHQPGADVIHLLLCCSEDGSIKEAIKQIESHVKQSFATQSIKNKFIPILEEKRWDEVEYIEDKYNVEITLKKDGSEEEIIVKGINDKVLTSVLEIERILGKLSEAEKVKTLGSYYWQFQRMDETWVEFDAEENQKLEELYQEDTQKATIQDMLVDDKNDKSDMDVDFEMMQLSGLQTYKIKRQVIDEFPKEWEDMGNDMYKAIQLISSSAEYKSVDDEMKKTVPTCQIQSIMRIQNKRLYVLFEKRKNFVAQTCKKKTVTRKLFHGTQAADGICRHGFDRSYNGKNATVYGQGNYFAVDAVYSAQDQYATPGKDGVRTMLLAEVITGDFIRGYQKMKAPPKKPWAEELYDSLVDDETNPTIFVVFNDASVNPSYVINYKK